MCFLVGTNKPKQKLLVVSLALSPGIIGNLESTVVGDVLAQGAPSVDVMLLATWSVDCVLVVLLDEALRSGIKLLNRRLLPPLKVYEKKQQRRGLSARGKEGVPRSKTSRKMKK